MLCVGVLLQLLLLPLLGDVIRHHPLMRQRSSRAVTSANRRTSLAHAARFQTATTQKYLELYKNGTTTTTTTIATAIVLRPLYRSTQRCPWVHFV